MSNDQYEERAALMRAQLEQKQREYAETAVRPTMSLPENVNDLLDMKREVLSKGGKLASGAGVADYLKKGFRSKALKVLRKAERGSGGVVADALKAVREAVAEPSAPRKSVLSAADQKRLDECYRECRAMQVIAVPPQKASLLAVELTNLAADIANSYGAEALPELELTQELAAELLVPLMQFQYDHGYVERPDDHAKMGKPFMGRIVPMGTPLVAGRVFDANGSNAWATPEEQATAPSDNAFTQKVVHEAAKPGRDLPLAPITGAARRALRGAQ